MENNFKKEFDFDTFEKLRTDDEILKYAESKIFSKKIRGTYTICDMHRMLYNLISDGKDKEEQLYILERAFVTAKKMDAKLRMYKHDYEEDWYENEKKNHQKWIKELKKK